MMPSKRGAASCYRAHLEYLHNVILSRSLNGKYRIRSKINTPSKSFVVGNRSYMLKNCGRWNKKTRTSLKGGRGWMKNAQGGEKCQS